MKQFDICLQTFEDVQDFVEIATVQPFRILVGNDRIRVNAKASWACSAWIWPLLFRFVPTVPKRNAPASSWRPPDS